MDKLTIRMTGRVDKDGKEYFFTTCRVPASIDLSESVIHFFPDGDEKEFGGDLVIRKHDRDKRSEDNGRPRDK